MFILTRCPLTGRPQFQAPSIRESGKDIIIWRGKYQGRRYALPTVRRWAV